MEKRRVMVVFSYREELASVAFAVDGRGLDSVALPAQAGLQFDMGYAPVALPGQVPRERSTSPFDVADAFGLDMAPEGSSYLVRAECDEGGLARLAEQPGVLGVYSDPLIETTLVCPGSAPLGSDADVERLLCCANMRASGMDGHGVLVAIVDTGINLPYLVAHGKSPTLDATRSWMPRPGLVPGQLPVDHGTMCAYDVCIAAPRCTLLDIALLQSQTGGPTPMSGLLSDAVRAYRHLIDVMGAPARPGEARSLVVNNSWGMFHPSWDFPVGHPGNYSDNPSHPFNLIVASLERAGADILFAAGNCGPDCADGRCRGVTANAIYGANGHPSVLCVAGVDTGKQRVGYSSVGPGRLSPRKPDLCGYTHFRGSGVYAADGGTSAATPVVAGVVAAVRSKRPFDPANPSSSPAAIRALVTSTAEDLGAAGYDFLHGHGVVNGCALQLKVAPRIVFDFCSRYPWLCRPPIDLCKRIPWLCRPVPIPPVPPIPPGPLSAPPEGPPGSGMDVVQALLAAGSEASGGGQADLGLFVLGYLLASAAESEAGSALASLPAKRTCACGGAG